MCRCHGPSTRDISCCSHLMYETNRRLTTHHIPQITNMCRCHSPQNAISHVVASSWLTTHHIAQNTNMCGCHSPQTRDIPRRSHLLSETIITNSPLLQPPRVWNHVCTTTQEEDPSGLSLGHSDVNPSRSGANNMQPNSHASNTRSHNDTRSSPPDYDPYLPLGISL